MTVSQSSFADALFDPRRPAPEGLCNPDRSPAAKRFDVYRNNVVLGLTEALATGFPVIAKLLGGDGFTRLAHAFVRAHPPETPVLMLYGAALPGFLEGFAPLKHLGYLPDVARLEFAIRQSYHAADAAPLPRETFEALPADRLMGARLRLAPAVRRLSSPWPILSIWRYNTEAGAPKPAMRAEDVLVLRPGYDPEPRLLGPGAMAFLDAAAAGETFGAAYEAAAAHPDFDLAALLSDLLAGGALTGLDD